MLSHLEITEIAQQGRVLRLPCHVSVLKNTVLQCVLFLKIIHSMESSKFWPIPKQVRYYEANPILKSPQKEDRASQSWHYRVLTWSLSSTHAASS